MIMCYGTLCSKRGRCKDCDRYEYFKMKHEKEEKDNGKQRLSQNVPRRLRRYM